MGTYVGRGGLGRARRVRLPCPAPPDLDQGMGRDGRMVQFPLATHPAMVPTQGRPALATSLATTSTRVATSTSMVTTTTTVHWGNRITKPTPPGNAFKSLAPGRLAGRSGK